MDDDDMYVHTCAPSDSLLRPQGTWITALGLLIADTRIGVSVDEDEETAAVADMLCPDKKMAAAQASSALSSCFLVGSVQVSRREMKRGGGGRWRRLDMPACSSLLSGRWRAHFPNGHNRNHRGADDQPPQLEELWSSRGAPPRLRRSRSRSRPRHRHRSTAPPLACRPQQRGAILVHQFAHPPLDAHPRRRRSPGTGACLLP